MQEEEPQLLTSRLSSRLSTLPFASRITSIVSPYLEAHHVPERLAALETYARSQADSAVNATKTAITSRTAPVLESLSAKYHNALDIKDSAVDAVSAKYVQMQDIKTSAVEACKTKYSEAQHSVAARASPVVESVKATHLYHLAHDVVDQTSVAVLTASATVQSVAATARQQLHAGRDVAKSAVDAVVEGHAIESLRNTATSVVSSVGHNQALVNTETAICTFATDLISVALDSILPPELDEHTELHPESVEESAPVVGEHTIESIKTLGSLAGRAKRRVSAKTSRQFNALKERTTQAVAHIEHVAHSLVSRNAQSSSTTNSATDAPDATSSPNPTTVTFAGFAITPVSRVAVQALDLINSADMRVHAVAHNMSQRVNRQVNATVSKVLNSAHATHQATANLLSAHPNVQHAVDVSYSTVQKVLPARIQAAIDKYFDWVHSYDTFSDNDGALADDEREEDSEDHEQSTTGVNKELSRSSRSASNAAVNIEVLESQQEPKKIEVEVSSSSSTSSTESLPELQPHDSSQQLD